MSRLTYTTNSTTATTHQGHITRLFILGVLMLFVSALWSALAAPARAGTQTDAEKGKGHQPEEPCTTAWKVKASPNVDLYNSESIGSVAVVSANDAWAVGHYNYGSQNNQRTLIKHWDGSAWTLFTAPSPGTYYNWLEDISVVSANDIWAVGAYGNASGYSSTFVLHWNGSKWTQVSSPSPSPYLNVLGGVDAFSATNVWVVGYAQQSGFRQTLAMRWDGTAWNITSTPNPAQQNNTLTDVVVISTNNVWALGYGNAPGAVIILLRWNGIGWGQVSQPVTDGSLKSISALSASDIWATGSRWNGAAHRGETLVEHWNGSSWTVITSPSPGLHDSRFHDVYALSSTNVWAVGDWHDALGGPYQPLIARWNGSSWSQVSSPSPGSSYSLDGLSARSSNDIWAVGGSPGGYGNSLFEHWNGSTWSIVNTPDANFVSNSLVSVDAPAGSATNAWAVGNYSHAGLSQTLIERWSGTSWSIATSPNVGTGSNYLKSVSVVSATDVWAVGYYHDGTTNRTLVQHWDGTAWTTITSPNVGTGTNILNAVIAVSAANVWAAGYSTSGTTQSTLIQHWDGSTWSIVTSPNQGTGSNSLSALAANSSNIWAVGRFNNGTADRTLIMRWDGSAWSIVTSPNQGTDNNSLTSITFLSASDAWAVGSYYTTGDLARTLTMRWDGSAWSIVTSPNQGSSHNKLYAVDASPEGYVWAVGGYYDGTAYRTLVEKWNGASWSIVTTPNPTAENNLLYGVTAVSSTYVWAAGNSDAGVINNTLVEQYDPCIIFP